MARTKHNTRKPSKSTQDVRIAAIARKVLLSTAETKVKTVSSTPANTSTAGTVINISNNIIEGDDIFDRNSTKILYKHIEVRYRATAVTASQTTRFILFRDMMNQGTTPSVSTVLPTSTVMGHYSDVRYYQQKRIHILHDWTVDLNIAGEDTKHAVKQLRQTGSIYYNGPTAVAASNGKGSMFLLVIGTAATGFYEYDITMTYNDS